MNVSVSKVGVGWEKRFEELEKKIIGASHKAVIKVGIELLQLAIKECPLDTGQLRESGEVRYNGTTVARGGRDSVTVAWSIDISQGLEVEVLFDTPYALRQHEVKYEHNVGKWKYLEDPLKQNLTRFIEFIISETAKEAKNG